VKIAVFGTFGNSVPWDIKVDVLEHLLVCIRV
jgi:hypothetical protein